MKYIPAEKLKAEIVRLKETNPSEYNYQNAEGYVWALDDILDIIASLQQEQPEVDLEREIIKYKVPFTDESEYLNETTLDAIASHFYELGLNARKEE